ncbi:glycosyltransferase family 2 protein [Agrobacterium sp. ES01]|uniref:glycosyltransferase family 2 protein n=1 Tax=Agrobacterium sp. ES01 TaxID=3420714 RepID=UPI003D0BA175
MAAIKPRLTICVPSRNRQYYFQKTIEGLLRRAPEGVEFVFADNSDDPSVMNDYMAELKNDPRIVYLPSEDRVLSMIDNWERTLEAATGAWVSIIGDDDFIDPKLADLLDRILAVNPEIEAFAWGVISYTWPGDNPNLTNVFVPYNSFTVKVPRDEPYKRMFGWVGARTVPTSGYSLYHSAYSRSLLDKIKAVTGKFFENPMVDYDIAMKAITIAKHFAYCQRPISIMGSCPESNSYAVSRLSVAKQRSAQFFGEVGRNTDEDIDQNDFPFTSDHGVTAAIAIVQQWYKSKYDGHYSGWEIEFTKTCARNTEGFADREEFDTVKANYDDAFSRWKGGKFLKFFKPEFRDRMQGLLVTGSSDDGIYLRSDIAGIKTPEQLYDIIESITPSLDMVEVAADGLKYPWEQTVQQVGRQSRTLVDAPARVA